MKNTTLLMKITLLFLLFFLCEKNFAQTPTSIVVTPSPTVLNIQNLLFGPDVTVKNLTINCPTAAYGTFTGTGSGIGLNSGLLLTTGCAIKAQGPNNAPDEGCDNSAGGDNCLENYLSNNGTSCVIGGACTQAGCNGTSTSGSVCTCTSCSGNNGGKSFDACSIDFDIIPTCDSLKINYVWASEEYPEYVNSNVSDGFAFFLSGPGINGTACNNSINIATVPGVGTAVSIDNVNKNKNSQYYIDNKNTVAGGTQYDAFTKVLQAKAKVTPCQTYHMK